MTKTIINISDDSSLFEDEEVTTTETPSYANVKQEIDENANQTDDSIGFEESEVVDVKEKEEQPVVQEVKKTTRNF